MRKLILRPLLVNNINSVQAHWEMWELK